jgi:dihydromethanopterin reductase (acceptor)
MILWCITGAGEFLKESVEVMERLEEDLTIFVSHAGREVLRTYGLEERVNSMGEVKHESDHAAMPAGKVTLGDYEAVVVSPATANSVAKIANGIADNLITTAVSLALKISIKTMIVPTDWKSGKVDIPETLTKGGTKIHMKPRKSDLRNIKYLEEEGITILESPEEVLKEI